MGTLYDAMETFFEADEWIFSRVEGRELFSLPFNGENGRWNCVAEAREDKQVFLFYSLAPVNVPKTKISVVSDFITRANFGLLIGNFELDPDDGELRYKTSVDVEDCELSPSLIRNLVYANVLTMNRYLPGLMSVIYGESDPAQAVRAVEGYEEE